MQRILDLVAARLFKRARRRAHDDLGQDGVGIRPPRAMGKLAAAGDRTAVSTEHGVPIGGGVAGGRQAERAIVFQCGVMQIGEHAAAGNREAVTGHHPIVIDQGRQIRAAGRKRALRAWLTRASLAGAKAAT